MVNATVHKSLRYSNTIFKHSIASRQSKTRLGHGGFLWHHTSARNKIVTEISSNLRKLKPIQLHPLLQWKVRRHLFTINILFKTRTNQPSTNPPTFILSLLIYILKNHFYDTRAISPFSYLYASFKEETVDIIWQEVTHADALRQISY